MDRTKTKPQSEWGPRESLPPDARVRLEHAGEWVAWEPGLTRAVAFGGDMEAVRDEAIKAGVARPVLERVPPTATRPSDPA